MGRRALALIICTACFARDYAIAPPAPYDVTLTPGVIYLDASIGFGSQPVTVTITRDAGFTAPIDLSWSVPNGSTVTPPPTMKGTTSSPITESVSSSATTVGEWDLTLDATSGTYTITQKIKVRIGRLLCDLKVGQKQSCPIPDGVTQVTAAVSGGGGGAGGQGNSTSWAGGNGGAGGFIEADVAVQPGDALAVDVGAGGGGGGTIGKWGAGGGGGGATIITLASTTIYVGGGGGGGGSVLGNQENTTGGNGGSGAAGGTNGACSVFLGCGNGGVCGTAGGLNAAGVAATSACIHSAGSSGTLHAGGTYPTSPNPGGPGGAVGGGNGLGYRNSGDPCYPDSFGGGGGGAGWFGGAGGDPGYCTSGTTNCADICIGGGGGSGGSSNAIGIKGTARSSATLPAKTYGLGGPSSGGQGTGAKGGDGRVIVWVSQ